ncbi:hypothetical protein [Streptomonospora sp. PA3]|uniref:hypothetical protein n=1 Tax=Streptomonospora sp. PA3 TaxID=2607326 RepID=UPI001643037B|nr:hypothetical protein [Streptomonospora sp. PA3]
MNAPSTTPHAEVAEIWPRDGGVRVVGDLHGAGAEPASWYLVAVLRDTDTRLRYELPLDGGRFDVSVPVEDFVPSGGFPDGGAKWDLFAVPEDRLEQGVEEWLRIGRHLDDIANKKKIMVFPAQQAQAEGVRAAVQPFYTIYNNLSVDCVPSPSDSSGKESP